MSYYDLILPSFTNNLSQGSAKEKEAVGEQVKSIVDLCLEKFTDPRKLMEFASRIHFPILFYFILFFFFFS